MGRCWFGAVFIVVISFWLLVSDDVDGYPVEDLEWEELVYYFLEAKKDPNQKPLALWLNGGPSCSSIGGGAFTELGPFFPRSDGRDLRRNSMSWNREFHLSSSAASNLLFVESPAGVGWSYSNTSSDCTIGDAKTGHCIPQLAEVPLDHNAQSLILSSISKEMLLNRDVPATFKIFWSHGMISDEIGLKIMNECDFDDNTFASPYNVTDTCNNAISQSNNIIGHYINKYDVILDVCYPSIVNQELRLRKMATKISVGVDVCMTYERRFYFNLPEVQKALHANRTKLLSPWFMCTYYTTVILMVGGWAIEYGNLLTFATVKAAAHMVPYAQPSRALHLFSSFVRGRRLQNTTHIPMDD
ncbi:hypothetical protein Peur_050860 [Populus x canadensis]